ncbi:DUF1189 family protein [Acholeplasma laidlawii]|uniref:DUF1189 family protein n=1 Tax=Acholeplasma laidlawii TaxID=2148 RepID=UPI0018C2F83B|nr:DUF1189 family protein [Acholeplasma laidlawii]MBG0762506.1 DUF1189 family protein [Acholeplasma laidlawii]
MYQRFKRALLIPSELYIYLKDSWLNVWVYFFLMLMLTALPFMMITWANTGFSDRNKIEIKEQFVENLSGTHKIVAGELIVEQEFLNSDKYINLDIYTIGIVNTPTSPEYQGIRIILIKDGVKLYTFGVLAKTYSYDELGLSDFDFSDYSLTNIDKFIRGINRIAIEYSAPTKVFSSFVTLLSSAIELIFFVIISATFSRTLIPFKFKFKIAVYVLTPYVVMSLFALFLGSGLFIFLGIILMMIYMRIAFLKLKMI